MTAVDVFAPGSAALITGGASGIGLAIAKLCRSKGMKVFLVDRDASTLQQAERELSGRDSTGKDVVTSVSDVSLADSWKALKEAAMKAFGGIELLVLNAGTAAKGGWGDSDYFRTACFPSPRWCHTARADRVFSRPSRPIFSE